MKQSHLAEGQVNKIIGKRLGLGIINVSQLPFLALLIFLCLPLIFINPLQAVLLISCFFGFFILLTGYEPTKFFERFRQPKKYTLGQCNLKIDKSKMLKIDKGKKRQTTYKIQGKTHNFLHIENKFNLLTYGQIELEGREIGFYLLKRGNQLMFIFGWILQGHDPSMTSEQSFSILDNCVNALNQIPSSIDLKCYQDLTADCDRYLNMQLDLFKSCEHNRLNQEIIKSRAYRAKKLSEQGRFLKNEIVMLAKYRIPLGDDYAVKETWLDKLLATTQPLVGTIQGKKFNSKKAWEDVIWNAYNYCYQKVNTILVSNQGFGLKIETLSVHDLWSRDYNRLHESLKNIPSYIVINEDGLQDPIVKDLGTHALGVLFESSNGRSAIPHVDRRWIYIPGKKKYGALIRIGQVSNYPKDNDSVARGHLKYLYNIISSRSDYPFYDSRIVSELTVDRSGLEIFQIERLVSNSIKREAVAAKRQNVDVNATKKTIDGTEALILLKEENNVPYWTSLGIWLYRDSKEQLEQDCNDLIQNIPGATVTRVDRTLQDAWFESWGFHWRSLFTEPNNRREKYISFQALPQIPLVNVFNRDRQGLMILSREICCPIYIDTVNQKNHTAIVAKSGAGKSNLILEILADYIIAGAKVVLFDFPRPDGTSTYTVLIPLLQKLGFKAAYHNVRENVLNIIELPFLEEGGVKLKDILAAHIRLLTTIVMGGKNDPTKEDLITSLLTSCYFDFHEEPEIKARYTIAVKSGYGSPEYSKMPIFEDFVNYSETWFSNYLEKDTATKSDLVKDLIGEIELQFKGILETPLGGSINGSSSFDIDVDILVIGLTGVGADRDSLIYAMSGLNTLYRGAFSRQRSLLGIDEGSILYKFDSFARETGIVVVHGRKWGCNFLIAAQEMDVILSSRSGNEIGKNLDNIFCGYIKDTAIPEMVKLGFREEILNRYTNESFKPSKELLQSYWYLQRDSQHLEVVHPVSEMILALGATDPDEDAARRRIMSQYEDPIDGLLEFGRLNFLYKKQGFSMDLIGVKNEKN